MMRLTEREIFVWWEEPTTGKVVWKYSGLNHGHQYQTLLGVVQRLELCVDSWHYQQKVLYWYECTYENGCVVDGTCATAAVYYYIIQEDSQTFLYNNYDTI